MHVQEMTTNNGLANHGLPTVVAQPKGFLRNILWSTDFSVRPENSLPFAAAFRLSIVCRPRHQPIHPVPRAWNVAPSIGFGGTNGRSENVRALGLSQPRRGSSEKIVGLGKTSRVLANMAQDFDIDLLILGTLGRTDMAGKILGAVAEETIRLSPCPVLSVGARTGRAAGNDVDFRHVLCATDFSLESISAVRLALEWAKEHSARLTVLHAVEGCVANTVQERRRLALFFEKRLQRVIPARAMQIPGLALQIEFGAASESILEAAQQSAADLLVLGVRGTEVLGGRPGRRTVTQVLRKARCPLLTVNQSAVV